MPGSISFNGIPVDIRTPGTFAEFSNARAQKSLAVQPRRILILGQRLAGGSAVAVSLTRIFGKLDGQVPFGRGSMLDRMIQALVGVNATTETWAMPVADNGAGVAATYVTTFTASPTVAGTLAHYIAGAPVSIPVTAGQSVASMATAFAAAINANLDLPVTAVAVAGVVTSTCRWKGLTGNDIDFRLNYSSSDVTPAGLVVATAAGVAGAGNPDITAAIAAMGDQHWHTIINPWTDATNLGLLATEMAARRGPMVMHEGLVFMAAKGSQGALATLGAIPNSPDFSMAEAIGPVTTWERAAREGGTVDFYGGIDPARPFQTLALVGDIAPNPTERFPRIQRDALLRDGISTHTSDAAGNVLLERPITTYLTNAAGNADTSYLDVNTMLTLGYLRYTLRVRWAAKFPRMKLADDGIAAAPGQAIVTPATLRAELIALARDWEAAGLVQNIDEFKSLLVVQRNATDRSRVDVLIPPDIVSGLRVTAAQFQFAF
jgi:phage tail sheath gpL-like